MMHTVQKYWQGKMHSLPYWSHK